MKNFITTVLLLICVNVFGQTVLFHENFDQPSGPDSVTTSILSGSPTILWNDTNSLYTSAGHSFHIKGSANNSEIAFQTQTFSTVGQNHVYLKFNHIAKIYVVNQARIEISTNNGATWTAVNTTSSYYGTSPNYTQLGHFNEAAYPTTWLSPGGGGINTPTNQWWKQEFFDLTSFATSTGGYSQVIVRFKAAFLGSPTPPNTYFSGWYVDDIEIFGSPCEIFPPELDLSPSTSTSCQYQILEGLRQNPTTFSHTNIFSANDNESQIDSLRLVEIINDTLIRYRNIPKTTGNNYQATFTNYNDFDTIRWKVEAYDNCGNLTTKPDTGYYQFYFDQSFPKCASGLCGAGHKFINTFPWLQDFEDNAWVEGYGNSSNTVRGDFPEELSYSVLPMENSQYGWSIRRNSTPALYSGPNGDHTTGNGKYLYSEFQNQNGQANTILTLPCIDLRDSVDRYFSFYYHMYGADINRLTIQIDSSSSSNQVWYAPLKILGQQQSSSTSPWQKAFIDLSPYKGKVITLRFAAIINPGPQRYGNIAIDDLEITEAYPIDMSVNQLLSPSIDDLACYGTSNIPVTVNLINLGINPLAKVPLAYQLDNDPVVYDTIDASSLSLAQDTAFSFLAPISFSPTVSHSFKVWVDLQGDQKNSNDTASIEIPVLQYSAINTFPHVLDFENTIAAKGQPANLNSPHWAVSSSDSSFFWEVNSGEFTDDVLSPYSGFGENGNCLVFRSRAGRPFPLEVNLESQCIDLSGLTNPIINYDYFASSGAYPTIYVREYGQSIWNFVLSFYSNTPSQSPLKGLKTSLAPYAGKVIQLKIVVNNPPQNYMAVLDNIMIREQPAKDLALTMVNLRQIEEGVTTIPSLAIQFSNWNEASLPTNYPKVLHVELTDKCNPNLPAIYGLSDTSYTFPSGLNTSATVNNFTFQNTIPAGNYHAKFWLETPGDVLSENDTLYQSLVSLSTISLPYFNDFENCYNEVFSYGIMRQWEIGTPQKSNLNSAYTGSNCIVTNADTNALTHGGYSYLELPTFSGLDTLHGAKLEFWQNFDFGTNNFNFGAVEIYDGQNWVQMTDAVAYGVNWKSYVSNTSNSTYSKAFVGTSNGWIRSSYPLNEFSTPGPKKIRFTCNANNVPGWTIDSLAIHIPSQNSGSPVNLEFISLMPKQGANNVNVEVSNTAHAPLSEIEVNVSVGSTQLVTESFTLNPPLKKGQSRWLTINNTVQLDTNTKELLIFTSKPNNRKDDIENDDTLQVPIAIASPFNDTLPVCFDFENTQYFTAYNDLTGAVNAGWEKGMPSKTIFNSAYQSNSAWFISGAEYQPLLNTYLYSPVFDVKGQRCYTFSFWHQFDTEYGFDGAQVEVSLDSGATWQTFGKYWSTDTSWYNTQFVQSLDGIEPGWSGSSNGWQKAQNSFKVFWDGAVQFRFRFASNASNHGEGWIIDDLCLEPDNGSCETVGLEDEKSVNGTLSLYPSPAHHTLTVELPLNETLSNWSYKIYNLQGQVLLQDEFAQNTKGAQNIDVNTLPEGFYTLQLFDDTGNAFSGKFVKK